MNHRVLLCLLLLAGFCACGANSLIFSNATFVDVENGLLRTAVAVTVQGDRITALQQVRELSPPADAQMIDCSGTFILPGLWDMHTHLLWEAADEFLPLCIANGVTGVRDLHTTLNLERVQALRREVQQRKSIGPRFLYSGPILDGPEPTWAGSLSIHSAEEARQEVRRLHAGGVDMIKVYEFLSRESLYAIVDECRQLGLPFGGVMFPRA